MELKEKIWNKLVLIDDQIAYHSMEMERLREQRAQLEEDLKKIEEVKKDGEKNP